MPSQPESAASGLASSYDGRKWPLHPAYKPSSMNSPRKARRYLQPPNPLVLAPASRSQRRHFFSGRSQFPPPTHPGEK